MAQVALLFGVAGRPELTGSTLRRLLADLGRSDDASRALLSRMHRGGQLTAQRHGRETIYRLDGSFARGFERIRAAANAAPPAWDGWFHTVLYRVPEQARWFRDALRRTAVLSGYGVLQPGILVAPRDYRDQLAAHLAEKPEGAQILFGRLAIDGADAALVISTAWHLDDVAKTYHAHIAELHQCLAAHQPPTGGEQLRVFAETVAPALTATLYEPSVPTELLPPDWPGRVLRDLVAECSARYGPAVSRYVASRL